jgi:hypothetical protein
MYNVLDRLVMEMGSRGRNIFRCCRLADWVTWEMPSFTVYKMRRIGRDALQRRGMDEQERLVYFYFNFFSYFFLQNQETYFFSEKKHSPSPKR